MIIKMNRETFGWLVFTLGNRIIPCQMEFVHSTNLTAAIVPGPICAVRDARCLAWSVEFASEGRVSVCLICLSYAGRSKWRYVAVLLSSFRENPLKPDRSDESECLRGCKSLSLWLARNCGCPCNVSLRQPLLAAITCVLCLQACCACSLHSCALRLYGISSCVASQVALQLPRLIKRIFPKLPEANTPSDRPRHFPGMSQTHPPNKTQRQLPNTPLTFIGIAQRNLQTSWKVPQRHPHNLRRGSLKYPNAPLETSCQDSFIRHPASCPRHCHPKKTKRIPKNTC